MAYCWGDNFFGQLGDGTTTDRPTPGIVSGGLTFSEITVGEYHSCAITTAGAAYCWGANSSGQLGDGTTTGSTTPTPTTGSRVYSKIGAGNSFVCALDAAGASYCWGFNGQGQVGDGTTSALVTVPTATAGGRTYSQLAAGGTHTCALTSAGTAFCWGKGSDGQIGDGSRSTAVVAPVAVLGAHSFSSLSAGFDYTCGVTTAGAGLCWGDNLYGQLGDGTTTDRSTPTSVSGGYTWRTLTASGYSPCAITDAFEALCWGYNSDGQIGNGTTSLRETAPTAVSGGYQFSRLWSGSTAISMYGLTGTGESGSGDGSPPVRTITLTIDPNQGVCRTSSVTGRFNTWTNLPSAETCSRQGFELVGFNVSADGNGLGFAPGAPVFLSNDNTLFAIWRVIAPEPFVCSSDLYQVSGTGGGVIYVYDPTRNTMDLVPDGGGPDKAPGSNATGYNLADDFIYGIAPNGADRHLWQFGSNGVYADLGPIIDTATGAPVQNLSFISGDFIADDVLLAIKTPNQMLTVDVAPTRSEQSAQATLQTLPTGVWSPADIAFNAERTAGYGMSNNILSIASLPGGDAVAQIAAIGQRSTFSTKTVLGVPARGAYGASYLDQENNAYFYNNEERRIYLITAAELAKDQPRAVPLGTEKAFVLGTDQTLQVPTDGASCPTAPIVTVTLTYDINGGEGKTPSDQTGFVDQDVTVADGAGFEKDNAVFAGWNTAPDGSGTNYTPGALFDLGASGGKLYAMWGPVEKAPPVPPENILDPITEPEPPVDEGDEVIFTPLDELPAPPNDPWKPSSLVLIDPDGGNPTPAVSDDSGDWSVNNRIGTVTYTPNPAHSGTAQITVQLQTESGARYESTLKTSVPSCEVGERVRATVYFDVLSSELDAQSRRTLNRLVREANSRGVPTCSVVVGFVQPTVNRSNDISLSTSRATSVADYLDDRGITRIIRTEGLGRADQQGAKARRATATIYIAPSPPDTPVDQ